jgi:hypothetical protein
LQTARAPFANNCAGSERLKCCGEGSVRNCRTSDIWALPSDYEGRDTMQTERAGW